MDETNRDDVEEDDELFGDIVMDDSQFVDVVIGGIGDCGGVDGTGEAK